LAAPIEENGDIMAKALGIGNIAVVIITGIIMVIGASSVMVVMENMMVTDMTTGIMNKVSSI
jgi:hypothetical protein